MPPPEANDILVLVPQTRRAIERPGVASGLTDQQVIALIADSVAEIILYTGGLFGHELNVSDRDDTYGAPTAWTIDPVLTQPEVVAITAQAALNYFLLTLPAVRTSETIRDEGAEWSYQSSAQLLRDHLTYLMAMRDDALKLITAAQAVSVAYFSFLAERDECVSQIVEASYWYPGLPS